MSEVTSGADSGRNLGERFIMKMRRSPFDTAEARGGRAAATLHALADKVSGEAGEVFVRESYEQFSGRVRTCLKRGLRIFANDPEGRRELAFRRQSWEIWLFKELGQCVSDIDQGRPFNQTVALTAIAWLEGDLSGFEETLKTTEFGAISKST